MIRFMVILMIEVQCGAPKIGWFTTPTARVTGDLLAPEDGKSGRLPEPVGPRRRRGARGPRGAARRTDRMGRPQSTKGFLDDSSGEPYNCYNITGWWFGCHFLFSH